MTTSGTPDTSSPQPVPEPASGGPVLSGSGADTLFPVGESVRLTQRPAYLKSADPMPMLRPPDLIGEGETGRVVEVRSLELRAVRFRRGTFLLSTSQLRSGDALRDPA